MDIDADLVRAQQLLQAGRWSEARPLLERLHAQRPRDRTIFNALCDAEVAGGAAAQALARLEALGPRRDDEAEFLRGRALHALGRFDEALATFRGLHARLSTSSFALEMHLAAAEARAGDPAAATAALERAAAIERASPAPRDAATLLQLARAEAAGARHGEVATLLERARQAGPRTASEWLDLARLQVDRFDWRAAAEALENAARIAPNDPAIATLSATAHIELGDTPAAERALDRAKAVVDDLPLVVMRRLLLPPVYADEADLLAWRARFTAGIEALHEELPRWRRDASQVLRVNRSNFLLAYQGHDDRELQRGYSSFLAALIDVAVPELRERMAPTYDGGRRLRVGFASSFFRECTIGHYFERWITGLDASRFERFVYSTGGLSDDFTHRLAAASDRFTLLRGGSLDAAKRIRADALDVLVYPEIGMDSGGYLLAALRLAPVQLAAWGHPVTTGSDAIDGFLTVGDMEPADGASHYVEPLVPLPGVGVDYPLPGAQAAVTRADLGLPAQAHLYACPQSLFKIHPAMDAALARIVDEDPRAVLLFFQGSAPAMTQRFGERLQRAFARAGVAPRNQVKFLPRLAAPHFRGVLALCDVVLDTLHWSGGNTSFDAFAAGTPVVSLPGRFMRGRQTAAMLGSMGLDELVAHSADDYVARALRAAGDRDLNRSLRERIVRRRDAIFEQHGTVQALGERLMALAVGG